jgi:hypothetical protein
MAQDVARGAPTEIDSICGSIVRLGREFHIPTPVNQALLQLLKIQNVQGNWFDELDRLPLEIMADFRALATQYQESK